MNRISSIQFNQFLYSISNTGAANDFANSNEEHDISPIEDAAARGKFSKIFLEKNNKILLYISAVFSFIYYG